MSKVLLYAPPQYWRLHPDDKKRICNACGPAGPLADYIPNHLFWLPIAEACNIHDFMYKEGHVEKDREIADRVFRNNLMRLVEAKTSIKWLRKLRRWKADKYYGVVKRFGARAFWKNKNNKEFMREC